MQFDPSNPTREDDWARRETRRRISHVLLFDVLLLLALVVASRLWP